MIRGTATIQVIPTWESGDTLPKYENYKLGHSWQISVERLRINTKALAKVKTAIERVRERRTGKMTVPTVMRR